MSLLRPEILVPLGMLGLFASFLLYDRWQELRQRRRQEYIRNYRLPPGLFARLQKHRPTLSHKDCELVAQGLRQFFLAYSTSRHRFVSMPSQVVDDLWHEFILYTRNYQLFCRQAFGGFLHHTPAVVLGSERQNNTGLRRCWWHACRNDNIDPRHPSRLPLLFALDHKLGIADGFHYQTDCQGIRRMGDERSGQPVHCGGDFSSPEVDGSIDGFGDGAASGGDGGGSDGGGGCGGGGGD